MSTRYGPVPHQKRFLPLRTKIGLGLLTTLMLLGAVVAGMVAISVGGAAAPPNDDASVASPAASPSAASESPSPRVSQSPPPASTPAVDDGTALTALTSLEIKGRAPKTGYDRDQFGPQWADVDRNGCDTRNDVLRRDLRDARTKPGSNGCVVMTGNLADPFSGTIITFVRGTDTSQEINVDHVVALSDAWQKGAQQLDLEQRTRFANDPLNLLAVQGTANQQKGDGDAATWLPANTDFRCDYVARQIAIKAEYELWMTQAEHDAIEDILRGCPDAALPTSAEPPPTADSIDATPAPAPATSTPPPPVTSPVVTQPVRTTPVAITPKPTPPPVTSAEPTEPDPAPADVYYKNCTAAWEAGAAPLLVGEPGYRTRMDGDGDGVACESRP